MEQNDQESVLPASQWPDSQDSSSSGIVEDQKEKKYEQKKNPFSKGKKTVAGKRPRALTRQNAMLDASDVIDGFFDDEKERVVNILFANSQLPSFKGICEYLRFYGMSYEELVPWMRNCASSIAAEYITPLKKK